MIFSKDENMDQYNDMLEELDEIDGCLGEFRALRMDMIDEYLPDMKIGEFLDRLDYEHFDKYDEYFFITSCGIYSGPDRDYTAGGFGIEYMIDEIADHANKISALDIDLRDMFYNLDRDFYDIGSDILTDPRYIEEMYLNQDDISKLM